MGESTLEKKGPISLLGGIASVTRGSISNPTNSNTGRTVKVYGNDGTVIGYIFVEGVNVLTSLKFSTKSLTYIGIVDDGSADDTGSH